MDKGKGKPVKLDLGIGYPPRRFGLIAIEKGFITTNDLWEALVKQKAEEAGKRGLRAIGSILNEQGRLTVSQINEVVEALKREEGAGQASKRLRGAPSPESEARRRRKE